MNWFLLFCGIFSAFGSLISIAFEIYAVVAKKEKLLFPIFTASLLALAAWGMFSYFIEERTRQRITPFADKEIICDKFYRYYGNRHKKISLRPTSFQQGMIMVPLRGDKKYGARFECYVDGNGFVQDAVISATLKTAFKTDITRGESKGSESGKFIVEIEKKRNGKNIVKIKAKNTGIEELVLSSPDCKKPVRILLNAFEENWRIREYD